MTPIILLRGGEEISPRFPLNDQRIRHWKFSKECDPINGTYLPGSRFRIVEFSKQPGAMWVKIQMPGRDPAAHLKISGEEYAIVFVMCG